LIASQNRITRAEVEDRINREVRECFAAVEFWQSEMADRKTDLERMGKWMAKMGGRRPSVDRAALRSELARRGRSLLGLGARSSGGPGQTGEGRRPCRWPHDRRARFGSLFLALACLFRVSAADPLPTPSSAELVTDALWLKLRSLPVGQRPRVGLVLSGGGAPGLAHIGVLKVFEREGVPMDLVVGTSVGAIVGALYAGGVPASEIEGMAARWGGTN
jgi:hypothetical protein